MLKVLLKDLEVVRDEYLKDLEKDKIDFLKKRKLFVKISKDYKEGEISIGGVIARLRSIDNNPKNILVMMRALYIYVVGRLRSEVKKVKRDKVMFDDLVDSFMEGTNTMSLAEIDKEVNALLEGLD